MRAFQNQYDTEAGYDLCIVEAKASGGAWRPIAVYSGLQRRFKLTTVDLKELDGRKGVKVRFTLQTDAKIFGDGWHIDDVQLLTGRPTP